METVKNLFLKARALLDEYTDDGSIIPDSDVIDMQSKSVLLADMAHKELYETTRVNLIKAEPSTISTISNTTEVNYKADLAIVYYIASRLAPFENQSLVTFFDEEFQRLKKLARNKVTFIPITDVYGGEEDV